MRIHSLTLVFPEVRVIGRNFIFFCVLPFGLSTACYVFTKLLRPLVKHWRSMGVLWGAKCVKNTYNAVFVYLPLIYKCGTDLAKYLPDLYIRA